MLDPRKLTDRTLSNLFNILDSTQQCVRSAQCCARTRRGAALDLKLARNGLRAALSILKGET